MLNGEPATGHFSEYEFKSGDTILAAISGGSDSTALLLLLKSHLAATGSRARLIAATVDHGLRAEAAAEAEAVAMLCRKNGIPHETLKWEGRKPSNGISAAARVARHRLLADYAEQAHATAVFTGHTRDDQAETVLMRSARADGAGAAGMAPATLFEGCVWFMRPLLNARREELRDWLRTRAIGWFDDPGNADARYERARMRAQLLHEEEGRARADAAVSSAREAAALRGARANWAAALLRNHAVLAAPGLIRLERAALGASNETALHALRALVAVAGGASHLPDMRRAAALHEKISLGNARLTLSRALVDARRDAIFFMREKRGLPPRPAVGDAAWDGRYGIVKGPAQWRGESPVRGEVPQSLLRAAAATLPDAPQDGAILPLIGPWTQFLPLFDIALAAEIARIVGAKEVPPPPFRRHITPSV